MCVSACARVHGCVCVCGVCGVCGVCVCVWCVCVFRGVCVCGWPGGCVPAGVLEMFSYFSYSGMRGQSKKLD